MAADRAFLVPSGYNFRAVLAFCRALRRAGQTPAIIACTGQDPIFKTSFARDVVLVRRSVTLDVAEFGAAVHAAGRRTGALRCVLAPTSEYLVRWAYREREALANVGCDLPLPDESVYLTVTDKGAFTAFAREQGFPVPREFPIITADQLPAVAKPRWNVAPDGRSLYPWLLRTSDDLARFNASEDAANFFGQEWVNGRSFYLLMHLPVRGEPTIYSQQNLAQQPGGKSMVLAREAALHRTPVARSWAEALRAAGFVGLVMVELRERGGDFVLIEANPRLWGPLQLCLDGCPALLMNYIAEHTGAVLPAWVTRRRTNFSSTYFWSGGLAAGAEIDWHVARPMFRRLALWRHLFADVYLRPDSWRYFLREHRPNRAPVRSVTARRSELLPAR